MGTRSETLRQLGKEFTCWPTADHICLSAFYADGLGRRTEGRFLDPKHIPNSRAGGTNGMLHDRIDAWAQEQNWHGRIRTGCFDLREKERSYGPAPVEQISDWLPETTGSFTAYCWNGADPGDADDYWYLFFWFENAESAAALKERWGI